jgi:hypothetical protein
MRGDVMYHELDLAGWSKHPTRLGSMFDDPMESRLLYVARTSCLKAFKVSLQSSKVQIKNYVECVVLLL